MSAAVSKPAPTGAAAPFQPLTFDPPFFGTMVAAVASFASKDDARPHLSAVHFQVSKGELRIAATNGHYLGVWRAKGDHGPDRSLLVPIDAVHKATREAGRKLTVVLHRRGLAVGDSLRILFRVVNAAFPPIEQVVPKLGRKSDGPVAMSGDLLMRTSAAFKLAGVNSDHYGIVPEYGGALDPVVFSSSGAKGFLAVVMPMRSEACPSRVKP